VLTAFALATPCAAPGYGEPDVEAACDQAESPAREYLETHGFTELQCFNRPRSLKTPKGLLDCKGKNVGPMRKWS
jgi:hypothetical protein